MPRITVLIPCFNGAKYMAPVISSIRNQTYTDFNVILINDGSTDESSQTFSRFAGGDRRFSIVDIPKNRGIVNALNTGLESSDSELIARLDVDDIAHPLRFERQLRAFRDQPNLGVVGSALTVINQVGEKRGVVCFPTLHQAISIGLLEGRFVIAHPAVTMRRDIVARLNGYDSSAEHAEDLDLWLRLLDSGCRFRNLLSQLTYFRVHGNNDTIVNSELQQARKIRVLCRAYVKRQNNGLESCSSASVESQFSTLQKLRREGKGLGTVFEEVTSIINGRKWNLLNCFYFHHFIFTEIKRATLSSVTVLSAVRYLPKLLFLHGVFRYISYFLRYVLPVQLRASFLNRFFVSFLNRD